jgi:hypothetical protein
MCSQIIDLYHLEMGFGGLIEVQRVVYICLIVKAYKSAKKKFN